MVDNLQGKYVHKLLHLVPKLQPDFESFGGAATRLKIADAAIKKFRATDKSALAELISSDCSSISNLITALKHPLSRYAMDRLCAAQRGIKYFGHPRECDSKCDTEQSTLALIRDQLNAALRSKNSNNFIRLLEAIASNLSENTVFTRFTPIYTKPDALGYYWEYPDASTITEHLTNLHLFLQAPAVISPLFKALTAIVILNCVHPFQDGNGRVSRIIFNGILQYYGMPQESYIPCKHYFIACDMGFTIRVRYTFMTNDWTEIVLFFCNLVDVHNFALNNTDSLHSPF